MSPRQRRHLLKQERGYLRDAAREALELLELQNPEEVTPLAFGSTVDEKVRMHALLVIRGFPEIAGIKQLIPLLCQHSSACMCMEVVKSLLSVGRRRATRSIMKVIKRSLSEEVTFSCVYGLWMLKDRRSEMMLRWVVRNQTLPPRTRGLAAEALGMFRRSLPLLLLLHDHELPDVRCGALYAVAASRRDTEALELFRHLLTDSALLSSGLKVCDLAASLFDDTRIAQ